MKKHLLVIVALLGALFLTSCGKATPAAKKITNPKEAVTMKAMYVLGLPLSTVYVYEIINCADREIAAFEGTVTIKHQSGLSTSQKIFFENIPAGKTRFCAEQEGDNGLSKTLYADTLDDIAKKLELDPEVTLFNDIDAKLKVTNAEFK